MSVKTVNVHDLKKMIDNNEDFQLVDVREKNEFDFVNMDGLLIPLSEVIERKDEIATDKKVIIHCRSGARSANAILNLQAHFGHQNLYNLEGGILAWAKEIDTSLPTY